MSDVSNKILNDMRMTPEQEIEHIKEHIDNAPTDYFAAVKRIMELEMRLEDLSRAVEIAEIAGQFNLVSGFRSAADDCLQDKKMIIKRGPNGDMKLTVLTGQLDPTLAGQVQSAQQPQTI
jgi:hypothetical protein